MEEFHYFVISLSCDSSYNALLLPERMSPFDFSENTAFREGSLKDFQYQLYSSVG